MKYEIGTFKRSNWMTFVLLTVVMVGFGIFAEAHVATVNTGEPFAGEDVIVSSQSVITPTAGTSTLNEFIRRLF